ncbi:MAG: bifunctional DNA-formamidopyrimidine glycosylase/DNA-(apurinic or apyrimidinic site) lyase, partial [Candidatus Cloacimonetes bacterium]|nr:bifunctional DNA-formamidopyrimidine glycosylase/DNA-(apurinic or apyrimidinic site) lyase [Candidatus Cloacimonadota bacterium]
FIRFIDPRTFGKISLIKSTNLRYFMPELGVEPLSDDFSADYLQMMLAERNAPIKNLLLDQRLVAGLGNIYVCELLYMARVRPQRSGKSITKKELKLVVKHGKAVLEEALKVGGTSISDYRRIDDKTGEFQNYLQVYQKKECPKGHRLENIRLGGRSSFYCPVCQK